MRDDLAYLRYILESIELVEDYLVGQDGSLEQRLFIDDQRTQDAVLRRLETLSDAASHLSDDLKQRNPQIPWRNIAGFRNVMAHAYGNFRLDVVWDVIVNDPPELKAIVERELRQLNSDE